jgi:ring-1,2-phenylacetyl-CoA epoxidase subunit PaaD
VVTGTQARAWSVLADVPDPEIPVLSVVDLGIVRDVVESPDGSAVTVVLTPTYSGCPATEVIAQDVETALGRVYESVEVRTRLSPAWTTDWLSPAGREKLAGFGIAPPNGRAMLPIVSVDAGDEDRPAECLRCGGSDLEMVSAFGSTPCKALWRCRTCLEPFDYFKVH